MIKIEIKKLRHYNIENYAVAQVPMNITLRGMILEPVTIGKPLILGSEDGESLILTTTKILTIYSENDIEGYDKLVLTAELAKCMKEEVLAIGRLITENWNSYNKVFATRNSIYGLNYINS